MRSTVLGIRPKNPEIKGCDISVPGITRCEPAPLQAAVVPPARAAAGAARRHSAGSGGNYTSGCACWQFWGEGNLGRGRGELELLDVARHDVSGGMWYFSAAGTEPLPRCCGGSPGSAGWPALRAGNATASASLRLPAGHRQRVPPHWVLRDGGTGGGGVLPLWPPVPAPAAGCPRHSWLTAFHTASVKRERGGGAGRQLLGQESLLWTSYGINSNEGFPWW